MKLPQIHRLFYLECNFKKCIFPSNSMDAISCVKCPSVGKLSSNKFEYNTWMIHDDFVVLKKDFTIQ